MYDLFGTLTLLAQEGGKAGQKGGQDPWMWFHCTVLALLMFGVFWFMFIRPERQRRQEKENMLDNLRKNDEILTLGGIIGTVQQIKDDRISIKVDDQRNTKIDISKKAVSDVLNDDEED